MRCLMCEEPTTMYIPSDDVDGVGLHSCGACGFEIEAPRDEPLRTVPADEQRSRPSATTTTVGSRSRWRRMPGFHGSWQWYRGQGSTGDGIFLRPLLASSRSSNVLLGPDGEGISGHT